MKYPDQIFTRCGVSRVILALVLFVGGRSLAAETLQLKDGDELEVEDAKRESGNYKARIKRARILKRNILHRKKESSARSVDARGATFRMVELKDGSEFAGEVQRLGNGDVVIRGHDYLPDQTKYRAAQVKQVRDIELVTVGLKSGRNLTGYLVKETGDFLILDRLDKFSGTKLIPRSEVLNVTFGRIKIDSKPLQKPERASQPERGRLVFAGGLAETRGDLQDVIPEGVQARMATDWPMPRFVTFLRGSAAFHSFEESERSLRVVRLAIGPVWMLRPWPSYFGQFAFAIQLGVAVERIESPTTSGEQAAAAAGAQLGYEFIFGRVGLGFYAVFDYTHEDNVALLAPGAIVSLIWCF